MREYLKFYINGEWVEPTSPKKFDVINPANEEVCAQISLGSEADVNKAVEAARVAFQSFGSTDRKTRIELLSEIIEIYKKRESDLAQAISEEMGAPAKLAIQAQASAGLGHLTQALEVLRTFEFEEGREPHRVFKEPIGVLSLIHI